ncbi:insulin-degrading enzyme-like [Tropilaelaps mercedesae]|uniref:Insulin-degrading enzyme-like n=1 Tax=Tropilaelaps mercedesae TaxID=418985 RepID=A0A1V9X276_9ACAR|nr:insulin-degrading enzyme-like [Tropilaelaps mercedesae]
MLMNNEVEHMAQLEPTAPPSLTSEGKPVSPKSGALLRIAEEPRKSYSDTCSYRALELRNGLKVLLVSNPETDKAAAALTVQVGYLNDPPEIPGIAHFCEHMLLLGTKKYPAENHYEEFICTHGGQRNAMTCTDETCYFFDIMPEYLYACLDIFSQFFTEPLFDQNCMLREKCAVDNENQKNIKRDARRLFRVNQVTSCAKHDYKKFGTGNMETLSARGSAELRRHLIAFHAKWYSPNIMSLVIYGKEPLDQLMTYAVDMFGPIRAKNVVAPTWTTHPFSGDALQIEIKVVPIDNVHKLSLTFPTPDIASQYKAKSDCYISHLLSHASDGGLIAYLRSLNWVISGESDLTEGARGMCSFKVSFNLSAEGVQHTDEIVTALFQYIKLLRDCKPRDFIFKELLNLAEMNFRFMPKPHPMRYVQRLSRILHKYSWRDVLSGPYLYEEFRPDLIEQLLSCIDPERMRKMVVSKLFQDQVNQVEYYYNVRYSVQRIPSERIEAWKAAQPIDVFRLPVPNNFIATKLALVEEEKEYTEHPRIIVNDAHNRIWFMQDKEYCLPRNVISCQIRTPVAFQDPLSDALTHLAVNCFRDHISGPLYPARVAGLNYSIINHQYGISIKVSGYNEKQQFLLENILTRLSQYKVDPGRFVILKDLFARRLSNFDTKPPHKQAIYYAEVLLCEKFFMHTDTIAILDKCTPEACDQHLAKILQYAYMECLIHGNISSVAAKQLGCTVRRILKCGPLTEDALPNLREYHLTEGHTIHLCHTNIVQPFGAVMTLYQIGAIDSADLKTSMLNELLCRLIDERVFNILRTKEQLGYIVSCETKLSYGTQGLLVLVQSDLPSAYIYERIETFMNQAMSRLLGELPSERFEDYKRALISLKLDKPKTIEEKTRLMWDEVCSRSFLFDRVKLEVEAIKDLQKSDIVGFYKRYIEHGAPERKQLVVCVKPNDVQGTKNDFGKIPQVEAMTLNDIHKFRKTHELFAREKRSPKQMSDVS